MNAKLRLTGDWNLSNVTLTAVAFRGPVYNERGLNLRILEGRHEMLVPDEDNELRELWDYQLGFYVRDCVESENLRQDECMMALVGELDDGRHCKIHGTGYVGRGDKGQIEGTFFAPPHIEIGGPDDELIEFDRPT